MRYINWLFTYLFT